MFIACGIDLSITPHPMIMMKKSGEIMERKELSPQPDEISRYLLDLQNSQQKLIFCAFNEWDLRISPLPKFLISRGINVKAYDSSWILKMENLLGDHIEKQFVTALCLARIIQSESIELSPYHDLIKDLSYLKRIIEQAINSLTTARAFPDEFHYPWQNKNW